MRFAFKTAPQHTTGPTCSTSGRRPTTSRLFESGWTFDHFYPIFSDSTGPCLEGWTTLAALAQATTRLRVGVPGDRASVPASRGAREHGRDGRTSSRTAGSTSDSARAGTRRSPMPTASNSAATQGALRPFRRGRARCSPAALARTRRLRRPVLPSSRTRAASRSPCSSRTRRSCIGGSGEKRTLRTVAAVRPALELDRRSRVLARHQRDTREALQRDRPRPVDDRTLREPPLRRRTRTRCARRGRGRLRRRRRRHRGRRTAGAAHSRRARPDCERLTPPRGLSTYPPTCGSADSGALVRVASRNAMLRSPLSVGHSPATPAWKKRHRPHLGGARLGGAMFRKTKQFARRRPEPRLWSPWRPRHSRGSIGARSNRTTSTTKQCSSSA